MKNKVRQNLPKWFEGDVYEIGDEVRNPFSGETCLLTAEELSMYDLIKGAEIVLATGMPFADTNKISKMMRKGLDWFIHNNPSAYYVLLD